MADDELRSLVGLLDVDEPIVIVVRHELTAHAQRLLVALGCGWVVDPVNGVRCSKQCRRKECRMSIDERDAIKAGAIVTRGNGAPGWEPNVIDWRHSRVVAMKRADAGDETLEICPRCECEVDTTPAPHRPGCPGIGQRANSATSTSVITAANEARRQAVREQARAEVEGLDLLERMDAGLPVADLEEPDGNADDSANDEAVLGEVAAVADSSVSGPAPPPLDRGEPERATASPSTVNPYNLQRRGKGYAWTRAASLQAVKDFHADHGRSPNSTDPPQHWGALPSMQMAQKIFGGWGKLLEAAELPATTSAPHRHGGGRPPVAVFTRDRIVEILQAEAERLGRPPGANEWRDAGEGRPTERLVRKVFGSWNAAIEAAGLTPRRRGATIAREPQHWITVNGTGLRYRSTMDAYVAADEIEDDGERVAKSARDDGNEGKADQAVDVARALAEKIRAAARAADGEPDTDSGSTIDSSREGAANPGPEEGPRSPTPGIGERDDQQPQMPAPTAAATRNGTGGDGGSTPAPSPEAVRLLVTPDEMDVLQRAIALAAIAAARVFADTLERELGAAE